MEQGQSGNYFPKETYLSGKEYSVAILEDSVTGNIKAMPIEIIVPKNNNGHCILDYDIKKLDEEKVLMIKILKVLIWL